MFFIKYKYGAATRSPVFAGMDTPEAAPGAAKQRQSAMEFRPSAAGFLQRASGF
jgi:hypothetical protein